MLKSRILSAIHRAHLAEITRRLVKIILAELHILRANSAAVVSCGRICIPYDRDVKIALEIHFGKGCGGGLIHT